jgi:hypothetical protein
MSIEPTEMIELHLPMAVVTSIGELADAALRAHGLKAANTAMMVVSALEGAVAAHKARKDADANAALKTALDKLVEENAEEKWGAGQ